MKPLHYISQRLRAVLLAVAALATMPAAVRAGDSFTVNGAIYTVVDSASVILTSYYGSYDHEITPAETALIDFTVPSNVINEGKVYRVTGIGDNAFKPRDHKSYAYYLRSIVIPASVRSIGTSAFEGSPHLVSVELGKGVERIGNRAFAQCIQLPAISLPSQVAKLGLAALSGCKRLTKIEADSRNSHFASIDGVLYSANRDTLLVYPVGKCTPSLSIGQGVKAIGKFAFYGIDTLRRVEIPASVTCIDSSAFEMCKQLASITGAFNPVAIGGHAFFGCYNLKSVAINSNVKEIGTSAFSRCQSLMQIDVDNANAHFRTIDGVLFTADTATVLAYPLGRCYSRADENYMGTPLYDFNFDYKLPNGTKVIPPYTFMIEQFADSTGQPVYCRIFNATIELPASIEHIGDMAFYINKDFPTGTFSSSNAWINIKTHATTPCHISSEALASYSKIEYGVRGEERLVYYFWGSLEVPRGCIETYRNATNWSMFKDISELDPVPDPEPLVGDLNGDGVTNVTDVVVLQNMILGTTSLDAAGDVNGDKTIDTSDVTYLIAAILNK